VPSGFVDDLDSHRYVLAAVFAETQGAIASGDLDALTEQVRFVRRGASGRPHGDAAGER
jgi:hypothetical protein